MRIVKIAIEKLKLYHILMKKQLRRLLPAILCVGAFCGNVVAANVADTDTAVVKQFRYDPYFVEALPLGAPGWMQRIAADPSGVNFKEMQQLYNEWRAADDDVRVRTVDNKPVVNYYRRWMAAYRDYVAPDGSIALPSMEQYAAQVDSLNRKVAATRGTDAEPVWRNIGPNRTYSNENGELKRKDSQVCVFRIAVALSDSATL